MRPRKQLVNYLVATGFAAFTAAVIFGGAVGTLAVYRHPLALSAYLGVWFVVLLAVFVGWGVWERRRELAADRHDRKARTMSGSGHG